MRLSVIGTGYLGATHAACMAELGHEVIGLDVDAAKVEALNSGRVPFHEPGLTEVLEASLASGRLRFTTSFAEAAEFGDVHFICVGTPQRDASGAADLNQVDAAVAALAPHLKRPSLVVGKSTVPVGTAARLTSELLAAAPAGDAISLVWNPEFLREGFAVEDTLRPDRIVIGTDGSGSEAALLEVYSSMLERNTPVVITDLATAELVKAAANAFLATKISFINAMAEICEATGADVTTLADAIGHDARIGRRFLNAGVGFGGGCLPKDIRAFQARARELGLQDSLAFLAEIDTINLRRRSHAIELAERLSGGITGARICVLGAAFKPHSDDVRDSPALDVAAELARRGADVIVFDPQAAANGARVHPELVFADSLDAALTGANVVLLLTEWPEFVALDPVHAASLVATPTVIDGRNVLDRARWSDAGWTIASMGRGRVPDAVAQAVR